jgi:glycosyltransferase involved in cell wall biosynthesis
MTEGAPLVSIVVPAFNHARFIGECLDSVLIDPYPNKELIVVDDGSEDDTADITEAWIEEHRQMIDVTLVRQANRGVSSALNLGCEMSSGSLIAVLGSDDRLLPGGIGARVEYLLNHSSKLAVFCDCVVIDGDGKRLHDSGLSGLHKCQRERLKTEGGLAKEIIYNWSVSGPVLMFRRQLLTRIGGFDERRKIEDWDFYLRMIAVQALGFLDVPVAAYRIHSKNASQSQSAIARVHIELLRTGVRRLRLFRGPLKRLLRKRILVLCWLLGQTYLQEVTGHVR